MKFSMLFECGLPSPPMSTLRPPAIIHVIGVPRPSLFFTTSAAVYYIECKLKNKNGEVLGTRLL